MAFEYLHPEAYERSTRMLIRTFKTTVEPTIEPITLEELKDRVRVTGCDDDAQLTQILKASRQQVEADTYRRLITQTVVGYMDAFRWVREIELRIAPISSITSITYTDQNSASQTFSSGSYSTDIISTPPRIVLKTNQTLWDYTEENTPNSVAVTMVAGYGSTAASVPVQAKLAIVEYARLLYGGCEDPAADRNYMRLVSSLQWTAYHKVM